MTIENKLSSSYSTTQTEATVKKVNWKHIGIFIALTFGLTWLLDLVLFLNGGLTSPAAKIVLQFQMLLPAFSAILLGMFFFNDSPINIKNNHSKSRWFTWYFLLFTLLYAAAATLAFLRPSLIQSISAIVIVPGLLGLILVIILRAAGGKDTFTRIGMGGGKPKLWILLGLGIILFMGLQTLLNWVFKLGQPVDLSMLSSLSGMSVPVLMIVAAAQSLILGPFLGLLISFGEEYGWRGYLQPALYGLGRVRAVFLIGIIWGIWHWPVIWMGYNYSGHPYLGSLCMVLFCVELAFLLGYAVIKAKGVWIAAFLHALVNQALGFFGVMVYTPTDATFSFGLGLPGLAVFALVIVLILCDPVWKQND